jgi:hypothetical protein
MTSFHLIPERREPPDLERFVAALVAFTLARLEAERQEAEHRGSQSDTGPAEESDG